MRVTQVLWKHNLKRLINFKWHVACQRVQVNNYNEEQISKYGIKVVDPWDIVNPKPEPYIHEFVTPKICFDNTHPDWKDKICYTFNDHNVLQEGVLQALLLLKTRKIKDELPIEIEELSANVPANIDDLVQRIVYTSNIFDAHQEKLPKRKDPNRPYWNFPRDYGLTNIRKIRNLSRKFLQLCECLSGPNIARNRNIVHDGVISTCIEKESDLIKFDLTMDLMITSTKLFPPIETPTVNTEITLPDLHPCHPILGLQHTNIYTTDEFYPIDASSPWRNVHTIFAHHNTEEVKNLTELPVREDQIHARSLIKSFVAAAGCAQQKYGLNVKQLPEPVVVQCVQSDGQKFHFSVFQLNTLDINGTDGITNFWWSVPTMKLFENAEYITAVPTVTRYNSDVFKTLLAFYRNN